MKSLIRKIGRMPAYRLLGLAVVIGGLAMTLVYGAFAAQSGERGRAIAAALLASVAPLMLGGVLGFLFGLPKSLQPESSSGTSAASQATQRRHAWQTNTNLEQVSDWFTKILLGIGLTQLGQVPEKVQGTGEYVAGCIGPRADGGIASAILITFSIAGFVIGYLLTKFDLSSAMDRQDGLIGSLTTAAGLAPNDRRAVEGLVFASLYLPEPDGFERAIEAAEAYLGREDHVDERDDGALNAYLACAYAQKYRYQDEIENSGQADLASSRAKALENARLAVQKSEEWKGWFRQLANPPPGSVENDLEPFRDDSEFLEIVEPKAKEPVQEGTKVA